jgi:hypothetical protein
LEQEAHAVWFLWRPAYYQETKEKYPNWLLQFANFKDRGGKPNDWESCINLHCEIEYNYITDPIIQQNTETPF